MHHPIKHLPQHVPCCKKGRERERLPEFHPARTCAMRDALPVPEILSTITSQSFPNRGGPSRSAIPNGTTNSESPIAADAGFTARTTRPYSYHDGEKLVLKWDDWGKERFIRRSADIYHFTFYECTDSITPENVNAEELIINPFDRPGKHFLLTDDHRPTINIRYLQWDMLLHFQEMYQDVSERIRQMPCLKSVFLRDCVKIAWQPCIWPFAYLKNSLSCHLEYGDALGWRIAKQPTLEKGRLWSGKHRNVQPAALQQRSVAMGRSCGYFRGNQPLVIESSRICILWKFAELEPRQGMYGKT